MRSEKSIYRKLFSVCLLLGLAWIFIACTRNHAAGQDEVSLPSPDGDVTVVFQLKDGIPFYHVKKKGNAVLNDSRLGFKLRELNSFDKNFKIIGTIESKFDSSWVQETASQKLISDKHTSLLVQLKEASGARRRLHVEFRVYNDGIRFRYVLPDQIMNDRIRIVDELTEFSVAHNFDVLWLPAVGGGQDNTAVSFKENKVSELSEAVQIPLTMQYGDSLFLSIHETGPADYSGMTLLNNGNNTLKCVLPGSLREVMLNGKGFVSPWRTIQIAENPDDLLSSFLSVDIMDLGKRQGKHP